MTPRSLSWPPRSCFQSRVVSLLSLLSLLCHGCHATIMMAGTGERFPSRPDHLLGGGWMDGYEYMAKLQVLQNGVDICDSGHTPQITPPSDGLPVVLLIPASAASDSCGDIQRVERVAQSVQPAGIVKYVILYDQQPAKPPPPKPEALELLRTADAAAANDDFHVDDHHSEDDDDVGINDDDDGARHHHHRRNLKQKHEVIVLPPTDNAQRSITSLGVLRVSYQTGQDLQTMLLNQSQRQRALGGPRVLMDGHISTSANSRFLKNGFFWLGILLMLTGCVCSFCLSIRLQMMDGPPPPAPNTRPERRRLTRDQVEEWLPERMYVGEEEEDGKDQPLLNPAAECSICLDDFHQDLIRQLPCGHVFHSHCICKWLTERSSTCPLCKLDLLPSDEDQEASDDGSLVESEDISSVEETDGPPEDGDEPNRSSVFGMLVGRWPWRRGGRRARRSSPEEEQELVAATSDEEDDTPLLQASSQDDRGGAGVMDQRSILTATDQEQV